MKKCFLLLVCLGTYLALASGPPAAAAASSRNGDTACFQWRSLQGPERQWQGWDIHLGGRIAADVIAFDEDNRKPGGFRWEALNPRLTATRENRFHIFVEADLLGVDTPHNLFEAWAGWDITPNIQARAGQIKVALSTEFATRSENLPSLDYGFTPYLDGRYDLGLQVEGVCLNRALWFEGSVAAGRGFDLDGHRKSDPQYSVRTVVFPAGLAGIDLPAGGFVGLAFAWSPDYGDEIFVQTPLRSTVFTTPDIDGDYFRCLHYEVGWYGGPFRLGLERVRGEIEEAVIGGNRTMEFDQLTSWSGYLSWFITGEQARWERGRWLPPQIKGHKTPVFGSLACLQALGCLELACRYSNADIDRGLFDSGITAYDPSTQEVRTATVNLNWYPRPGLKIAAGWVKTIADHELTTLGNTNRDSSYVLRVSLVL
jgi:hypothetical protein